MRIVEFNGLRFQASLIVAISKPEWSPGPNETGNWYFYIYLNTEDLVITYTLDPAKHEEAKVKTWEVYTSLCNYVWPQFSLLVIDGNAHAKLHGNDVT